MRTRIRSLALWVSLLTAGCTPLKEIDAGKHRAGRMELVVSEAWNQLPVEDVSNERYGSRLWTRNGTQLDQLFLIPEIPDGETVFVPGRRTETLDIPPFRLGMTNEEIMEVVGTSFSQVMLGRPDAVETAYLEDTEIDSNPGFRFSLRLESADGQIYHGLATGFIHSDQLYLMTFIAATPYYYEHLLPDAEEVMNSVRIVALRPSQKRRY